MPEMKPLISIVIPTYNRLAMLKQAVASCFAQTYQNYEIIISDDGSTDGTGPWAESMVAAHPEQVRYIHGVNAGACTARNAGVAAAKGVFIQFLDSDDLLREEKLEAQIRATGEHHQDYDVLIARGRLGDTDAGWEAATAIGDLCNDSSAYLDLMCSKRIHVMQTTAGLWRRDFFLRSDGWDTSLRCSQEWELHARLMLQKPRIQTLDAELFWVRSHAGEQISKDSKNAGHWSSVLAAHHSIYQALCQDNALTPDRQAGLLLRLRSAYLNVLRFGDTGLIRQAESIIAALSAKSVRRYPYAVLVGLRRIIGRRALLRLLSCRP